MDDKILNIFRSSNGEFISGEEISEKLKVSRAAVWKHIEQLRKEGYEITGEPHVRSEEHTSEPSHSAKSRMPSSA